MKIQTRPRRSADPSDEQSGQARLLRALLAHARHELRTPLNAIIGYSELLLEELEDYPAGAAARYAGDIGRILRSGTELLALVNEVLGQDSAETVTDAMVREC